MRTRLIHLRLDDEVCNAIAVRAGQLGLSMTSYFRLVIHAVPSGLLDSGIEKHFSASMKKGETEKYQKRT